MWTVLPFNLIHGSRGAKLHGSHQDLASARAHEQDLKKTSRVQYKKENVGDTASPRVARGEVEEKVGSCVTNKQKGSGSPPVPRKDWCKVTACTLLETKIYCREAQSSVWNAIAHVQAHSCTSKSKPLKLHTLAHARTHARST